jgi:8-amino-3,8-dideoxy-alpha-D-manno-octulosonate transaminase
MNELTGAVALAQLRKIDRIIAGMQENKKRIKDAVRSWPGLTWRPMPDETGDAAAAIFFYVPTPELAVSFVQALTAENIVADQLYNGKVAYMEWPQLANKRTITPEGCPFACPLYSGHVEYGPGLCPKAEDLFPRSVRLCVSPLFTEEECLAIAHGVNKVARHFLARHVARGSR